VPEEPVALLEGVSMWPTLIIRYLAIIVAINGIIAAYMWSGVIKERIVEKIGFTAKYASTEFQFSNKSVLSTFQAFVLFVVSTILTMGIGHLNIPSRGNFIFCINVFSFFILAISVLYALTLIANRTKSVINYIENKNQIIQNGTLRWLSSPLNHFAWHLKMPIHQLHEWVSIRLIGELVGGVNRLLIYPMLAVALHVLSRISYFGNWVSPPGLLMGLGACYAYLFYWDFRLKNVAKDAEEHAMSFLRKRLISSYNLNTPALTLQLEKLVENSASYAKQAYKPFFKRPIFQGLILVIVAAALDYFDYGLLVSRLFN
jgi:hypothetical protein